MFTITSRLRLHAPSPALVVSLVALIMALGGTSYAAFTLPQNSVGTPQLKNGAVTSKKLHDAAVTTGKIKNGAVTGSKMNFTGVTVPNANHANTANTANSANAANTANTANSANTASHANTAATADTANIASALTPAQAETPAGALSSSWVAYDAARTPEYYKDQTGVVRLSGAIYGGTIAPNLTSGNVAFTLPAGDRPAHTIYEPVVTTNGNFTLTPGYVGITTDGAVHIIAGNNGFVSLDGLTLRAGG